MSTLRPASAMALLPDLERCVLSLIAEGLRDHEVAAQLGLANSRRVPYRVNRIREYLGLEAVPRPQLVDHAYTLGALPAPDPLQPLVLKAEQYHLVWTVAAGSTIETHAQAQRQTRFQVNHTARKAQRTLDATTLPALVHRAWQRQILGPTRFAGDLARMHAQQPAEPDLGRHVIVPLASGHRLALPAWGFHPTRHLDVPTETEALAAARFLSGRDGYAPVWVSPPKDPRGPYRVSWGRPEAIPRPQQGLVLIRPRQPPLPRSRSA